MDISYFVSKIGIAVQMIISWIGFPIRALFGAAATDSDPAYIQQTAQKWSAVLPLVLLGVGVSFVMLGVKIYKWVTTFVS